MIYCTLYASYALHYMENSIWLNMTLRPHRFRTRECECGQNATLALLTSPLCLIHTPLETADQNAATETARINTRVMTRFGSERLIVLWCALTFNANHSCVWTDSLQLMLSDKERHLCAHAERVERRESDVWGSSRTSGAGLRGTLTLAYNSTWQREERLFRP